MPRHIGFPIPNTNNASSNAVVAIIGVMIISYGLNRVGLVNRMIQPLLGFVGRSASHLSVVFCALIALISSVMQNTGAAVLFLPGIRLVAAKKLGIPVSRVLMPIGMSGFGSGPSSRSTSPAAFATVARATPA